MLVPRGTTIPFFAARFLSAWYFFSPLLFAIIATFFAQCLRDETNGQNCACCYDSPWAEVDEHWD